MKLRSALFLDRDGVVNSEHGYVYRQEDFEFVEGIFDLCRAARQLGYLIFVVTNQAGIGRGFYTEQDFLRLSAWMCRTFQGEGAAIDRVYFSPYHPEDGVGPYRVDSPMRKPGPGMILQAAEEFGVELGRSVSVGDQETDIEAGVAAGVGHNLLFCPSIAARPTHSAAEAVVGRLEEVIPFLHCSIDPAQH
jgi:D-glycero-D-manno-heptose 1,7-bisphosphate phosphatase